MFEDVTIENVRLNFKTQLFPERLVSWMIVLAEVERTEEGKMMEGKNKVFETRTNRVWLGEDRILRLVTFPVEGVTLEDAQNTWRAVEDAGGGVARPILGDIREVKNISREARKFYSDPQVFKLVSAIGLQVDSPLSRVIGTLFLGINKPPVPIRLFRRQAREIKWLKTYVEEVD